MLQRENVGSLGSMLTCGMEGRRLGDEEGFLRRCMVMLRPNAEWQLARGQHVGRREADHLPGHVESPRHRS